MHQCFWAVPVFSLLAGVLSAEEAFPKVMKVAVSKAEVRSGPFKTSSATSLLSQGDEVLVLKAVGDGSQWFAIKPPKGSFSWIEASSLKKAGDGNRLGIVEIDPERNAKVLAGSVLENREPDAVAAYLQSGTIIQIIERPLTVGDKTWYPIAPHSSEVRYLHKSQLSFAAVEKKSRVVQPGGDEVIILRQRIDALEKRVEQLEKRRKRNK